MKIQHAISLTAAVPAMGASLVVGLLTAHPAHAQPAEPPLVCTAIVDEHGELWLPECWDNDWALVCEEDMSCWDPCTMGNRYGYTADGVWVDCRVTVA